ncbi:glycerophosphodiester phosphodiesterase [Ectobacillus panaciterrae]|uniref:glycerophosphodiester phosphodiesterase n=1 Tax=Ectobacillus panaciterrae TaxID=363872 RepID=UPI0004043CEC|nr:glycerophosphodiester phosphodiesterase [Ectobacillus panaciterrae]
MKIYAHRGVPSLYPENTMIAFQEAVRMKCNGIELDVQLTKDDVPVVIHDETLERTTNGTGWVKDYTYEELCTFNASYKYREELGHCPIPTLEEVCQLIQGEPIILNIELKNEIIMYPQLEEKVYDMIRSFNIQDQVVVSSFNHESLKYFHSIAKDVQTAVLTEKPIENVVEYIKGLGASGYHPDFSILTKELAAELNANDIAIRPYTVNDPKVAQQLRDWGISAIVTDCPQIIMPLL